MKESDRMNQDEYTGMGVRPGSPEVDRGTPVEYFYKLDSWVGRWPSNVRLPVAGEWITFNNGENTEATYTVKSVDWFFDAENNLGIAINLT